MSLVIQDLNFYYSDIHILKNISFTLNKPEILILAGPNGAGKSTLLKCINKILHAKSGKILLDGKNIDHITRNEIAKKISYIPQSYRHDFAVSVFDLLLMGRRPYYSWSGSKKDIQKVMDTINLFQIDDFSFRSFISLSGGEKQKILLARAFVQETEIILLDEPTNNLDIKHQFEILNLIRKLSRERNISIIMTLHDLNMASIYADRIMLLNHGKINSIGKAGEVFNFHTLKDVYGIESEVINNKNRITIIPTGICN